jgi:hypothetical protein
VRDLLSTQDEAANGNDSHGLPDGCLGRVAAVAGLQLKRALYTISVWLASTNDLFVLQLSIISREHLAQDFYRYCGTSVGIKRSGHIDS